MKHIAIILLLSCFSLKIFSQTDIASTFNSTHSGRSITLVGTKTFNEKHEIGIGVRYNINKLAHNDDQNNAFLKRQYATNFIQHWGAEAFYHHYIFKKLKYTKPFVFYDLQVSYSETRNRMFLPGFYDDELGLLYKEVLDFFGPFTWVEQCIGFGIKAKVTEHWFLYQKIGFGTTFILGKDEKRPNTYDKFEWEFAGLIQAGLVYRIKK
jgi:hypothetical protein